MHALFRVVCIAILFTLVSCQSNKYLIMQVTDVHGWVAGHPHNQTLNADFGDFCSLVYHMYQQAEMEGYEFLLFDSGDIIEGTGISDATPIHGQYIFPLVQLIKNYTALTAGNHDLGHFTTVQLMEESFIPYYNQPEEQNNRYLTANVMKKPNEKEYLGQPYSVYTTKFGTNILIIGWIFNFTQESKNSDVVIVSEALQQPWFQDAMNIPGIDMIITTMHIDPQATPELDQIYTAVRQYHPTTPFILFSGHRHVLYFEQLDENSFTLESGKYFEVLGLVKFELENQSFVNFAYEWMPTARSNFYNLSNKTESEFLTKEGQDIKDLIAYYTNTLHLNDTLGCSPETFYPRLPIIEKESLYNLYVEQIVPSVVFNHTLPNTQYFITNTATLRYNLFAGRVDVNDIYAISPFYDDYVFYPAVPGNAVIYLLQQIQSFLVQDLEMTPYFDTYETLDVTRPAFTHTLGEVQPNQLYDVICASYDAVTLTPVLQSYLNNNISPVPYPTRFSSTSAIGEFVIRQFPCNPKCPC